jgi:dTDP-4-dehydrorhamnose 3,5-epimerase
MIRELALPGAWLVEPEIFTDHRGVFFESYRSSVIGKVLGRPQPIVQMGCSTSRHGVVRGIHYSPAVPGQGKYVTCPHGGILDVVVDIRWESPTYGRWQAYQLDDVKHRGLYISPGLGHAFMALTDTATVVYLCSEEYAPEHDLSISPLDPELAITWPGRKPVLSSRDRSAPLLAEARRRDLLPRYPDQR